MSVLLTHGYFLADDEKEQQIMRPYAPLGILYISAYLEQQGIANEVFDTTFSTKDIFRQYLFDHTPQIIGMYANLMTKLNVIEAMHFINEHLPHIKIVLGGPDVKYNAANYLQEGADYIVMGEGEETMYELCNTLLNSSEDELSDKLQKIRGIAYMHNGQMMEMPERDKIKELDHLPFPNRKKIDLHLYLDAWRKFHGTNAISVSTMRGCPYTCKWCSRAVYGLSYRRRSVERVVQELCEIKEAYNPDSLWFVDDVFTISHKWLTAFRDELKKRDILIPYECITRADRMNEEVIKMLKETGCFRVWIGAESGSQRIIDLMDRRVDVQQVRDMIQLTKKYGIQTGTFIMLGYPGETEADIEETIKHLKESDPDHFTITVAYPIKGTELYQEVEAVQTTKLDWSTSTDRQVDFERMYSRKYYDYAVRRVINEVNYFKARNRNRGASAVRLKAKSMAAKLAMRWQRITLNMF
ncbi:MAG TPA: radical SAM protein [Ohtaekwangia sp.]|uniref:B12-binding domain-containing radical SAM protein n=1 Tax=Ohtaekwangia sp. TaxID=2066019 RepID=UPI002F92BE9C